MHFFTPPEGELRKSYFFPSPGDEGVMAVGYILDIAIEIKTPHTAFPANARFFGAAKRLG